MGKYFFLDFTSASAESNLAKVGGLLALMMSQIDNVILIPKHRQYQQQTVVQLFCYDHMHTLHSMP